ncbi:hypothetical protein [Aliiroseovarius sp. 2305UL8-7]|uniref:hypothetical protein n=1 Tax=Aliiroseovarius conchicola TaxID=3121637 RepID=UPI003528B587
MRIIRKMAHKVKERIIVSLVTVLVAMLGITDPTVQQALYTIGHAVLAVVLDPVALLTGGNP